MDYNLFILFVSVWLVGVGFWFYNRRQLQNLSQIIDDKQAVIDALRSVFDDNQPMHQPMFSESDTIEVPVAKQKKTKTTKKAPAAITPKRSSKKKS